MSELINYPFMVATREILLLINKEILADRSAKSWAMSDFRGEI